MADIILSIPEIPTSAFELMSLKTISQAFEDMVIKSGIPLLELKTFGMQRQDIYWKETGATHHHVTWWQNGLVSVTRHGDWAELIAIEDWGRDMWPTGEECMVIYERCVEGKSQ